MFILCFKGGVLILFSRNPLLREIKLRRKLWSVSGYSSMMHTWTIKVMLHNDS